MFEIWTLLVFLVCLIYYWRKEYNPKAPPGPTPWPILGNLVHMARASDNLTLTFAELGKKYGEIFSLQIGMKPTVILTSKEAMETVLSNESSFGRDRTGMFYDRSFNGKNLGVITSEGQVWETGRAWTFKTLREFGFGKTHAMEHYIQNVTETLYSRIEDLMKKNGTVYGEMLFSTAILTIIWEMLVGRLSDEDKKDIQLLSDETDKLVHSTVFGAGLVNAFPFLRYLFPESTGYNEYMSFINASNSVTKKLFLETLARLEKENHVGPPNSFTEAFIQNSLNSSEDKTMFNMENYQLTFQDLMLASTETTSSFMEFVVLFLILHPEVQEKVYQEILEIAPDGRFLTFADRKKMVYTQAFILETHRNGKVLQNFVPRKVLEDITYKEYIIKKGTMLIVDSHLYNNDESVWGDADEFRPERFIDDKGELCNASDIISFSFGKRNCPGELYANVVTFLCLTSLLQKLKVSVPPGKPLPRKDPRPGLSFKPYPYDIYFTKRSEA